MDPLPRILYHGTTTHLAKEIKAHGLQPRDGQGPFLTSDPKRARGYAVRASCLALAQADPTCDLAHLPPAVLVVATVPATALLRDLAHAGDYWLAAPTAAKLRLERFDARPFIASPSEAQTYARRMREAQAAEDRYGPMRRRHAEGKGLGDEPPARRKPEAKLDPGTPWGLGTRPNLGKPLG
jgi:hypothetical protein